MASTDDRESAVGTELELEVTNVAHGGVFVARHEGRVIFVGDTIPGERIRARVTEDQHPSFWRAETLQVLRASPHRTPHVWASASIDRAPEERAGGAEFGHIALDHQRELKRQVISGALVRMARCDYDFAVEPASGDFSVDGTGWRTRVRLQVDAEGRPGPYAARSHHVVAVGDLPLATGDVASAAPLDDVFRGAASVDVIGPSLGEIEIVVNPIKGHRPHRSRVRTIRELVGDREFELELQGFWQVHRGAAITLTHAVQDVLDAATFDPAAPNLDLYGGVGLLAAAVGDRFGETTAITSVESSTAATGHAVRNLSDWSAAKAVTARVENYLTALVADAAAGLRSRFRRAAVILDPPRAGAGKRVVESISDLEPAQVVYVACDPVALARDIALFSARGYRLQELRAFDLFPATHHVEAVARLTR